MSAASSQSQSVPVAGLAELPYGRIVAVAAGLLLVFAAIPAVASEYWLNSILVPTIVIGLAGIGLNLLMGYTGLVSLGSAGLARRPG